MRATFLFSFFFYGVLPINCMLMLILSLSYVELAIVLLGFCAFKNGLAPYEWNHLRLEHALYLQPSASPLASVERKITWDRHLGSDPPFFWMILDFPPVVGCYKEDLNCTMSLHQRMYTLGRSEGKLTKCRTCLPCKNHATNISNSIV